MRNDTPADSSVKPRGLKIEPPFCWQSKTALRRIASTPTLKNPAYALLVYLGLCWEASDKNNSTFTATKGYLAQRCGISKRTVEYALDDLESVGVLKVIRERIEGKKANAINTYTLLSLTHTVHEANAQSARGSRTGNRSSGAGKKKNPTEGREKKEKESVVDGDISTDAPRSTGLAPAAQPSAGAHDFNRWED